MSTEPRGWDPKIPIIAGGPHPTISPEDCLNNNDIQLCVIGEGEITLTEIVEKILKNDGVFPSQDQLDEIAGLAFLQ